MKIYTVYKIINEINQKKYIGYTSRTITERLSRHFKASLNGSNTYLHNAIRKYGIENFTIEELYQSKDRRHTRKVMEPYFISEYDTFAGEGYNLTEGGEGFTGSHRVESKQKMSDGHKGLVPRNKGKTYSCPKRKNIPQTEETKRLISKNCKGKNLGQVAWNKGLTKEDPRVSAMYEHRKPNDTWKENFKKIPLREKNRLASICKPVLINGIRYSSAREACNKLGNIKYITLIKRIKSQNFPEFQWDMTT